MKTITLTGLNGESITINSHFIQGLIEVQADDYNQESCKILLTSHEVRVSEPYDEVLEVLDNL